MAAALPSPYLRYRQTGPFLVAVRYRPECYGGGKEAYRPFRPIWPVARCEEEKQ